MPVSSVLASTTSATTSSSPVLRQGSGGAAVRELQQLLKSKGHNVAVDGSFGPKTKAAVLAFQRARGLAADGVVGPKTWAALRAKPAAAPKPSQTTTTLRVGAKGAAVVELQNLLKKKGANISADGSFGPATLSAVKNFQRSKGLAVDGVVGPKTWSALRGAGGSAKPPPSTGGKVVTGYNNGRPTSISVVPVGNGQYLNSRAAGPYKEMIAAAKRAGINLTTTSGFRTHEQQKYLYNLYLSGKGNLAAKPGYSNHQMGLAVDIGGVNGYGTKAFKWLQANAGKFGFVNDVKGEWWHWTYKR